jgi:hypothetical protein
MDLHQSMIIAETLLKFKNPGDYWEYERYNTSKMQGVQLPAAHAIQLALEAAKLRPGRS